MKDSLRRESAVDIQDDGDPYWFNNPQYRLTTEEPLEVGHLGQLVVLFQLDAKERTIVAIGLWGTGQCLLQDSHQHVSTADVQQIYMSRVWHGHR